MVTDKALTGAQLAQKIRLLEPSALVQTLDYIKLVEKNFVDYENVLGIIVAYDFTNELKEEAAKMSKISLKKYRCDFSFTE
ncbi:hypothetical protein ES705_48395 [subsurface metagenome]